MLFESPAGGGEGLPSPPWPIQPRVNVGYCRPFWERAAIKLFWNYSWKSRLFPRIKTRHKRKSGHIYHTRPDSRPHAALYPRPSEGLISGVSSGVSWIRDSVLYRAEACKSDIAETPVNRASCAVLQFGARRLEGIRSPTLYPTELRARFLLTSYIKTESGVVNPI